MSLSSRLHYVLRLLATVRHLKVKQIVYQLWYRVRKRSLPSSLLLKRRALAGHCPWIPKVDSWEPGNSFTFLNQQRAHKGKVNWQDDDAEKLWLYNLHYFDYLCSSRINDHEICNTIVSQWIDANTDVSKDPWEPYPTSLRIVNWIKYDLDTGALNEGALHSLALQVKWLYGGLEYHILANHLFANIKALLFAGVFFEGDVADRWLVAAIRMVKEQLAEQILEDGGHYERSPMYHATILEDVLDLVNIAVASNGAVPDSTVQEWKDYAVKMNEWHQQMLHPDGELAFFNDSAFGIAASSEQLDAYSKRLDLLAPDSKIFAKRQSVYLQPTGFAILRADQFTLLSNLAPIGPSYQPGHAHADTLSCELSVGPDRVIVNSGTSTYFKGELRDWQRSTAAHSTVAINGESSSDTWDGFRVGRRAHLDGLKFCSDDSMMSVEGSHNGYRHLSGSPIHQRVWQLTGEGLTVTDTIRGSFSSAIARVYLHPDIDLYGRQQLRTLSGIKLGWSVEGGDAKVVNALWYPQFGVSKKSHCIDIHIDPGGYTCIFRLWKA